MTNGEPMTNQTQLQLRIEPLPNTETIPAEFDEPARQRIYGVVWHDQERIGLYSADLFQRESAPRALLSLGLMTWNDTSREWEKLAVAVEVRAEDDEYAMTVLNPNDSPFAHNGYLGRVLHRDEFLQHATRDTFFELANHIASLDKKISGHFG